MKNAVILRRGNLVKTDISEERRFLKEPNGVTFQMTAFFNIIHKRTRSSVGKLTRNKTKRRYVSSERLSSNNV
jgi:hypothetical protein